MNKFIKKQLEQCRVATIPEYNDSTTHLLIASREAKSLFTNQEIAPTFQLWHTYSIEIDNSLITPCNWYTTIHSQWNNNIAPTDASMIVCVEQFAGKMMKIVQIETDGSKKWEGWLPMKDVKLIQEVIL